MHATLPHLSNRGFPPLTRRALETLQVNLGYRCNQACLHCHVNAGPTRREQMQADTIEAVLAFIERSGVSRLDLTGGAPELNPHFRTLVARARALGVQVIDRCNLTIVEEPGQDGLAGFLAAEAVEIVASLPCYLEDNVDAQRGAGVYATSIRALRRLNRLGYGQPGSGLAINLMYNPVDDSLPPAQQPLEEAYRRELFTREGVLFNHLYVLANMPIQRFGSTLISKGGFEAYMDRLQSAFQPGNLDNVMCRSLLSVDWQGRVFDCDFNQMLDLPLALNGRQRPYIGDLDPARLADNPITVRDHCYGCTAGQGSSCGGALD